MDGDEEIEVKKKKWIKIYILNLFLMVLYILYFKYKVID